MKAIETSYKGYNFRSRLEARWAVFFDTMGIKWEYEAQGFECSHRLTDWLGSDGKTFSYLPDFWLPELEVFAEVKGTLDPAALGKVMDAAAYLSTNGDCGCLVGIAHNPGYATVMLGPIPDPDFREVKVPVVVHLHKGDLLVTQWSSQKRMNFCPGGESVATDMEKLHMPIPNIIDLFLNGMPHPDAYVRPKRPEPGDPPWVAWKFESHLDLIDGSFMPWEWCDGYRAARSARFEFGQSGATRIM